MRLEGCRKLETNSASSAVCGKMGHAGVTVTVSVIMLGIVCVMVIVSIIVSVMAVNPNEASE